jgi:hypothetical protein
MDSSIAEVESDVQKISSSIVVKWFPHNSIKQYKNTVSLLTKLGSRFVSRNEHRQIHGFLVS